MPKFASLSSAQFIATFFIKSLNAAAGRKGSLTVGSAIVFAACAIFYFLLPTATVYVYPAIALLGIGCAIVMVVSQQLQADLVGQNTTQGAFVYGAHSFADKLSNGVAIFVVQKINGDANTYVREFLVFVPAAAMLLALLFTYLLDLALMDGGGEGGESQASAKAAKAAATAGAGVSAAPTPRRALADRMDSKMYQPISSSIE